MFCPQCGKENEPGAAFCFSCGAKLEGIDVEDGVGVESAHRGASDAGAIEQPASAPASHAPMGASLQSGQAQAKTAPAPKAGGAALLRNRKPIVIIAAAVVVVLIAIFAWYNLSGASTLGQTGATFRQAFEASDTVRKGIADNDFVNETPYSVTSFECTDIRKSSDYEVTAHVKAVIENESFKTEVTALATYVDGTKLPSGYTWASSYVDGYGFDITGSTTTPKKGIDKDDTNIARSFESVLSDDGMTCTATVVDTEQTWFVDAEFTTVHTYRFSNDSWTHVDVDTTATYDYHDIEGTYVPKGNSEVTFTIKNLDSDKESFTIDYVATESNTVYNYNVSGTLNVRIAATAKQDYSSKAMQGTYEFEGTGTCSGGDGQASVKGTLEVTDSGEAALSVSDLSVDYTTVNGRNAGRSRSGMLFKQ